MLHSAEVMSKTAMVIATSTSHTLLSSWQYMEFIGETKPNPNSNANPSALTLLVGSFDP